MRVAIMSAPGQVQVEDRPDPAIVQPTDAVIRLAATCVCGSEAANPDSPGYSLFRGMDCAAQCAASDFEPC